MKDKILNAQAITLTWENVSASVGDKVILDNISGYCKPGQMLAIMGPSGAGKTTLLSLFASKKNKALSFQGTVLANNTSFTAEQFYNFGVYIFQNDILHSSLTVKQTLGFISQLLIKNSQKAEQRVEQMIATFELQKCKDTFVGGQLTKGISGGQKKRLCIAVEMIADPDLLILDEPTSGLDSHKVKAVVRVLRRLALQKNKTVIFTLHQPSFLIFQQLDRLLLINKGKTVYQGKSADMYSYLSETLRITVPLNCTLPDFFMMEISEYKEAKFSYSTPLNHQSYCMHLQSTNKQWFRKAKQQIQVQGYRQLEIQRNFIEQFVILIRREWVIFMRNRMKGVRLIMISFFMVFIVGLIFLNAISNNRPDNGQLVGFKRLRDYLIKAQGTCYIAVLFCIMSCVSTVTLNFPNDKEIYYKESSSKKYRSVSHIISKIITEAGLCMTGAVIVGTGEYLMVGYTLALVQFHKFILTLMVCCLIGNSLALLVGTFFKDARRASALTPLILMPMMIFSGMYTRLDSLYGWISWIQYISPFKYGLHSLLLNEFHDQKYVTVLGVYDYRKDLQISLDFWQNILVLVGLVLLFYGMAFVILRKLSSNLAP